MQAVFKSVKRRAQDAETVAAPNQGEIDGDDCRVERSEPRIGLQGCLLASPSLLLHRRLMPAPVSAGGNKAHPKSLFFFFEKPNLPPKKPGFPRIETNCLEDLGKNIHRPPGPATP